MPLEVLRTGVPPQKPAWRSMGRRMAPAPSMVMVLNVRRAAAGLGKPTPFWSKRLFQNRGIGR